MEGGSFFNLRAAFRSWTDCLLDSARTPIEHLEAARAWHDWGLRFLGIDDSAPSCSADPYFADSHLPNGKAISPLGAIRCIREYRRTAVFLQAMAAALREARRRFPGETLHVVEAGCGPLAPLALPFALRYAPAEVQFTLLDYHPVALEAVQRVVAALGLQSSIRAYIAADATAHRFSDADRPHVIACEVLLCALKREPQVATTVNLAPQLRRGGIFVPERIDVEAALFDSRRHLESSMKDPMQRSASDDLERGIRRLGPVFSLDAAAVSTLECTEAGLFRAGSIRLPRAINDAAPLHLLTDIRVFGEHRLVDFESSLNLPERVSLLPEVAASGGRIDFAYDSRGDPGLRVVACRPAE